MRPYIASVVRKWSGECVRARRHEAFLHADEMQRNSLVPGTAGTNIKQNAIHWTNTCPHECSKAKLGDNIIPTYIHLGEFMYIASNLMWLEIYS